MTAWPAGSTALSAKGPGSQPVRSPRLGRAVGWGHRGCGHSHCLFSPSTPATCAALLCGPVLRFPPLCPSRPRAFLQPAQLQRLDPPQRPWAARGACPAPEGWPGLQDGHARLGLVHSRPGSLPGIQEVKEDVQEPPGVCRPPLLPSPGCQEQGSQRRPHPLQAPSSLPAFPPAASRLRRASGSLLHAACDPVHSPPLPG